MDVQEILEAGQVTRYHSNPQMNHRNQTNADHSWGVCAIMLCVWPGTSRRLLMHGLFHDLGERKSGDLPAPFKQAFPEIAEQHRAAEATFLEDMVPDLPSISEFENGVLKFADLVEAGTYVANYAANPKKVEGWGGLLNQLTEVTHWLDSKTEGTPFYDFVIGQVHPTFEEVDPSFNITPF